MCLIVSSAHGIKDEHLEIPSESRARGFITLTHIPLAANIYKYGVCVADARRRTQHQEINAENI